MPTSDVNIGVIALKDRTPSCIGKNTWDGVCIVVMGAQSLLWGRSSLTFFALLANEVEERTYRRIAVFYGPGEDQIDGGTAVG
jgi:hypothetical protein